LNQSRVPGRSCDVFDLLADTVGLALAPLVVRAFTRD
jgi:VanZ family protein